MGKKYKKDKNKKMEQSDKFKNYNMVRGSMIKKAYYKSDYINKPSNDVHGNVITMQNVLNTMSLVGIYQGHYMHEFYNKMQR
jgi:uncharacterized protein with NRDE domain